MKVLVNWGSFYGKKIEKTSHNHNAEKTEKGDPLGFFNIHSVGKYQTIERGTLCKTLCSKKNVSQSRKYSKEVPFGLVEFLR